MLENVEKLLDVIEALLDHDDVTDPAKSDKLASIGERLEALAMDIKDRTSS